MSDPRWRRIEELFQQAADLAPAARSAFLAEACAGDEDLLREVESLLAHAQDDNVLSVVIERATKRFGQGILLSAGMKLGPYEILTAIGAGGMGEVYRARDPRLNRDVALKILRPDLARDVLRRHRFETEARAVAALNHPNIVAVFDTGKQDGISYMVSELVDGEPLSATKAQLLKTLEIAVQIAAGLAAAHEAGVVHRDLKPDNILLTRDGRVKILDFGLAQVRAQELDPNAGTDTLSAQTATGMVMGTVGYMSPEQVRGLPLNHQTDLFSFGVVLYEMVTGERPFKGSSAMTVCDAILHTQPRDFGDRQVPGKLKAIIKKLLEKDLANRYQSAVEVHEELKALKTPLELAGPLRLSRNAWIAVGAVAVLAVVLAGWLWRGASRRRWALETAAPEADQLVEAGEYVKAAGLVHEARLILPKDPTLEKLWIRATGEISISTLPAGADVWMRPYRGGPNAWEMVGKTPLQKVRVPLNTYVWRMIKPGFAPGVLIAEPPGVPTPGFPNLTFELRFKLRPEGSVLPGMRAVSGGRVFLMYPLGQVPGVQVDDFLIDQHEVTNEEYKKFVDAGGYQKREFWKQLFVKDGRTVPWEKAIALFHDAMGRPGPATWELGDHPKGKERHPVAGISWYEAAAYAEFAGKTLPTAYHWTRAGQVMNYAALIASASNFRHEGTQPIGGDGTLSGFGTTDMAGNVKEWCLNEAKGGKRLILGGGFGEPSYMFHDTDTQSPWDRRANFGVRCVKLDSPPTAAAAAHLEVATRDYWKEQPVSNEVFKAYTTLYAYDKGDLNERVEETEAMDDWSRTKVTFGAAYGHDRLSAHLFLPKNGSPPYQTIVYFPGASALIQEKLDLLGIEDARGFLIKSGRALMIPIYKGMYERRDGLLIGGKPPAFFRDHVIEWAKDLGRSLDYLETRKDIDVTKVAYFGDSLGGVEGSLFAAVEKRIRVAILASGGFQLRRDLPEVDPFNFVPHVTIPVLMLNGRYDATFPLESSPRPLFHFLGTPDKDKKHVIYEGGHGVFPRPAAVRESLDWLDKYLGPIRH